MTVDERMGELAETLRQLRAEDTRLRVSGALAHGYRLNPPLSEAGIQAFESEYGIRLPEDYRLFLRMIGDGGPGLAYGPLTLSAAAQSCDPRSPFPFAQGSAGSPDDVLDRWSEEPFGVLELCHHGCAIYSYLVVNGAPRGTIWDGGGTDVEPTELGFLEWYGQWADASLRKVRSEQRAQGLRVGMSTDEVMQAVEGAWKKRSSVDGSVTYFEAPGIPAQLEVDADDRVTRIIPWQFL